MNTDKQPIQALPYSLEVSRTISVQRGIICVSRDLSPLDMHLPASKVPRGEVAGFSASSRRRMASYLRNSTLKYSVMVTLTYPGEYSSDGAKVKEDLRRMLQEMYRYHDRRGIARVCWGCFWFLEFQDRGAPHFHIFCAQGYNKDWISSTWYRIVGSEDSRHLSYGTKIEKIGKNASTTFSGDFEEICRKATIRYAMKYAAKFEQKVVPANYTRVGRFWGIAGNRSTVAAAIEIKGNDFEKKKYATAFFLMRMQIDEDIAHGRAHAYLLYGKTAVVIYKSEADFRIANIKARRLMGFLKEDGREVGEQNFYWEAAEIDVFGDVN